MCLLYIAICFGVERVQAQSCFVQLGDATGMKFSVNDSIKLDSVATTFKNILPSAHQSDFKVFSAGIYWHAPLYEAINDFIDELLTTASNTHQGQFHLAFFIIKSHHSRSNWRIITRMNLPEAVYNCTDEQYNLLLKSLLQMDFSVSPKNAVTPYSELSDQIEKAIISVRNVTDYMLNCCDNFRSSECNYGIEIEELIYLLTSNDYVGIYVDSIDYSSTDTIIHPYLKGINFKAIREDFTLDVLEDIGPFLDDLDGVLSGFGANSLYFDGTNLDELLLQVSGEGLPLAFDQGNNQRSGQNSNYNNKGMLNFDILGVSAGEVDMFFIRKREGIVSGEMNIPGKIYVVKAGTPSGVDFELVKTHTESFMACSNIKIPIELKLNGIPETSLNIRDAVCIVAKNASMGVNLVQGQYCTLYKDGGFFDSQMVGHKGCHETDRDYYISPEGNKYDCSYFRGVHETASAKEDIRYPGTEEITNRGGRVSIVMCDRIPASTVARFKASNKSELIGFYILHVSGHNTGIVHLHKSASNKQDYWFMEPGEELISHLILQNLSLLEFSNSDPEINKCVSRPVQNIQRWIKARFLVK